MAATINEPTNETYKEAYMRCATLEDLELLSSMDMARAKYYGDVESLAEMEQALLEAFNKNFNFNKGD